MSSGIQNTWDNRDALAQKQGVKTMQDTLEIAPNEHESPEANDGDIIVEHIELNESQFREKRLSRQDQKSSLCDLLRNGQTNQAPSFIK